MTELLQQAISAIQQLPIEQQDAIASRFLAEIQDEKAWEERFEATTDTQWDNLAAMVRQEIKAGDVIAIAEVFPAKQ
jgi:RNA polymerase-interacting CarD/CdnL/TRCF family regulator